MGSGRWVIPFAVLTPPPTHTHKEALTDRELQTLLLNKNVPSEVPAFILPLFFVQELVFLAYLSWKAFDLLINHLRTISLTKKSQNFQDNIVKDMFYTY